MNFDLIIKLYECSNIWFILAVVLFILDMIIFKNIQNIFRFNWKTLLFLIPFIFLLVGFLIEYPVDLKSNSKYILTFATICLAILFFLLNKTHVSIAKDKEIAAAHKYNCLVLNGIIDKFGIVENRNSQFYVTPFITEIYKENLDYIFLQSNNIGNIILDVIATMEKSNNIMNIAQNMNVEGLKGEHSRKFLKELNKELYDSSVKVQKFICNKS